MLDAEDFNFGYQWYNDESLLHINHLWLNEKHRNNGHGSFIIETLVRFAYYEGAEIVEISIGGGEHAEAALKKNGFYIFNRRPYSDAILDRDEDVGEYGVDGVRKVQ